MSEHLERETVRWAYRFLLGRDPESEAVVDNWCGLSNLSGLLADMLSSQEIARLAFAGFPEHGHWIETRVTEEATKAALTLRDGASPTPEAIEDMRLRAPSLRALRQMLLASPAIKRRLPQPEGPRRRVLHLPGGAVTLTGDSRDPEFLSAPGLAPRWARLLRAVWPDGGEGRVILEDGAGIGIATLGLATGAPGHAALIAHETSLRKAAALAGNLTGNGLSRAASRAVPLDDVPAAMARESLTRLDLLRLGAPDAVRQATRMAPWLLRPDRRDELLLCPDLGWLERYARS